MDYKKTNAPLNTVTRDMIEMSEDTGNVYETVCIVAKRANQIAGEMKHDLEKKLQEFASLNDNLEEISENREQIEISRYYEKLPKPTLIAAQEYVEHKIHFRNPSKEKTQYGLTFYGKTDTTSSFDDDIIACIKIKRYLCTRFVERHTFLYFINQLKFSKNAFDPDEKVEIFEKYGKGKTDTGSPEAQIALFSIRIAHLTQHLKSNHKDYTTARALKALVGKRRRLLDYLIRKDINRYRAIIAQKELGIRK